MNYDSKPEEIELAVSKTNIILNFINDHYDESSLGVY